MTRPFSLATPCAAIAALLLAGCQTTSQGDVTRSAQAPAIPTIAAATQPESRDGTCWAQLPGTPVTELVEQTILVEEAVTDGRWFERVCDAELSPNLIMTLQRALAVRAFYGGPITGKRRAEPDHCKAAWAGGRGAATDRGRGFGGRY